MFTSVQVNRFLFRVKEQPQGNKIVTQKTVQSKRICLCVFKLICYPHLVAMGLTSREIRVSTAQEWSKLQLI